MMDVKELDGGEAGRPKYEDTVNELATLTIVLDGREHRRRFMHGELEVKHVSVT